MIAQPRKGDKPDAYYAEDRRELIGMIPRDVRDILDIGCGEGAFGKLCKEMLGATVTGIEINPACRSTAEASLDRVLTGDATALIRELTPDAFDLIACNDILEHLADPRGFLREALPLMRKGGYLLCSIPNFRYAVNMKELIIEKDFRYRESGILDETHLRFFTDKSIRRMFRELEMEIVILKGINTVRGFMALFVKPLFLLTGNGDMLHPQFAVLVRKK